VNSEPNAPRDLVTRLNETFAAIGGWSFDNRWWVVAISFGLLAGSLVLAGKAEIDSSYEAYFNVGDPTFQHYDQYREDFGSDEVSYILYEAPDAPHGPWNLEVMRKIVQLTETLEDEVPFVYEVQSVASAELMEGRDDSIEITKLVDEFPETQEELLDLRERYLNKPMFVGGIISADGKYGAIIIEMDRSSTDPLDEIRLDPDGGDGIYNLYPQVTDTAINEILARPEYAGINFYHSGDVPMNAVFNVILTEESGYLSAVTAAVIAVVLCLFFRSIVGMVAPVVVVQLSVIMTVAFVVAVGWKLDMSFEAVPTLLTAIGVAHSVHILSEFRSRFAEFRDRRAALVKTFYLVGTPCLFTSVTTAIGFGSMSFAPIKSIAHQGVYASFGIMASFVLSFTLLMALLSFGRKTPRAKAASGASSIVMGGNAIRGLLGVVLNLVLKRSSALVAVFALLFALSFIGISRMVVDSNWLDDFSSRMPIKQVTVTVDEVMGGVTNLIVLFDSGEPDAVKNPEVLREIERIQEWGKDWDIVRKSYSIVDVLKDLNQSFHGEDPEYHVLPDSRELAAQYLILYESAGGSEASKFVSSDYQHASLEYRLALAMTSETAELVEALEHELEEHPLEASTSKLTGIGALWVKLLDYIISSQIWGFTIAFTLIAIVMCGIFGSVKIGMIAMIPNLSPVLLTLGVMGWLGIPLDYNKVSIAAVAMGIAVDDTIHLMSRVRYEFGRLGNYRAALDKALHDVGRAVLITSIALVAGFLVLLLSLLDSNAMRGILLATTIVAALVADFLLMPALILMFKPFGKEFAVNSEPSDEAVSA
jgi:predicted RND superfamily exporter protein